jgi:hypothetical protein
VYKIMECFAIAKQAEFNGDFNWFLIRINNCVPVGKLAHEDPTGSFFHVY